MVPGTVAFIITTLGGKRMKTLSGLLYTPASGNGGPRLDIHTPDAEREGVCTYIYFHGGGLTMGARDDEGILALAQALTARGIVLISADYSLYPEAVFPDFIRDAARAVRWVFDQMESYHLPRKVFLGGSSAGSYLTMMLCFAREYLAEVGLEPEALAGYVFDAGQPTSHFEVLSRRGIDPRRVLVDEAAPLYYVQDARPSRPLLLFCAQNDMPGRLEQNMLLMRTLQTMGYDDKLMAFHRMAGCEHCSYLEPQNEKPFREYVRICADFLAGY
jgi:acetyl esterase/lipase